MNQNLESCGYIGLLWGDPSSCLSEDAETFFLLHPELRELAELFALEACVNSDVPDFLAIYPYRRIEKREGDAVRVALS